MREEMKDATAWIRALGLSAHPEGGYFRETWRSARTDENGRSLASQIYFLLSGNDFSAFHRIDADEIWHLHEGGPLTISTLSPDGVLAAHRLGARHDRGESPQVVVTAGLWFAAALDDPATFGLVGCTAVPGFEYARWELGDRSALLSEFPQHRSVIERLTRTGR